MTGVLISTGTVKHYGIPYVPVILDVSVFDLFMSDSLSVSAVRLTETDYGVIFRVLSNAVMGFRFKR